MGEKIRDLGEIHLNNETYIVEENVGTHNRGKYDIHIQNPLFRLNMNEIDFLAICTSVLFADKNREYYKEKYRRMLKTTKSKRSCTNE